MRSSLSSFEDSLFHRLRSAYRSIPKLWYFVYRVTVPGDTVLLYTGTRVLLPCGALRRTLRCDAMGDSELDAFFGDIEAIEATAACSETFTFGASARTEAAGSSTAQTIVANKLIERRVIHLLRKPTTQTV